MNCNASHPGDSTILCLAPDLHPNHDMHFSRVGDEWIEWPNPDYIEPEQQPDAKVRKFVQGQMDRLTSRKDRTTNGANPEPETDTESEEAPTGWALRNFA